MEVLGWLGSETTSCWTALGRRLFFFFLFSFFLLGGRGYSSFFSWIFPYLLSFFLLFLSGLWDMAILFGVLGIF